MHFGTPTVGKREKTRDGSSHLERVRSSACCWEEGQRAVQGAAQGECETRVHLLQRAMHHGGELGVRVGERVEVHLECGGPDDVQRAAACRKRSSC